MGQQVLGYRQREKGRDVAGRHDLQGRIDEQRRRRAAGHPQGHRARYRPDLQDSAAHD
ncbi:hypothetical protein D3C73_1668790 [compost metagenome]